MILSFLTTILAIAPVQPAPAPQSVEFKSAMIYNIARFATWPQTRFADAASPVVLCASPSNPLSPALNRLEGEPVGTRKLRVRLTESFGPACHLAVVSPSDAPRIATLNQQGVLTVGDAPGFTRDGAVGLVTIGRQTRFEVNTQAARSAGVVLSSQLLRLAIAIK